MPAGASGGFREILSGQDFDRIRVVRATPVTLVQTCRLQGLGFRGGFMAERDCVAGTVAGNFLSGVM